MGNHQGKTKQRKDSSALVPGVTRENASSEKRNEIPLCTSVVSLEIFPFIFSFLVVLERRSHYTVPSGSPPESGQD